MLGWLQGVVGVMLPTLVAGGTAPPAARLHGLQSPQIVELGGEAEEDLASPCTLPRSGATRGAGGKAQRLATAAGCTLMRLDLALRDCCRGAGRSFPVAVTLGAACCLLAGNVYALARGVASSRALAAAQMPAG